jgi:DNA-directed RNA polymerase specialized sigma24 family protein
MNDEFDDCFPALGALAYRVGYRLLGDRGEAEEIAQETLARAYVRRDRDSVRVRRA